MAEERTVEARRLRGAMDRTRASIADTADELREHVHKAVDWREHVKTHPGTSLGVAATTGMLMGRWVGAKLGDTAGGADLPGGRVGLQSAMASAAHTDGVAAADHGARDPALPRLVNQTWTRVGSRLEGIVNQVIDDVAQTVETVIIPPLLARIRGFFGSGGRPETR
jgi:hypothetical protein